MSSSDQAVTFQAIFNKATTTIDGGWNVTLSVSNDEAQRILQLSNMRDQVLQVAIIPSESGDFLG
jgi:hypothetical protein